MNSKMKSVSDFVAKRFGVPQLRDEQNEALFSLLARQDVLLDLPTGFGKSLVFQAYALLKTGLVLVVEPFIALINDQHAECRARNIQSAIYHGSMTGDERTHLQVQVQTGTLKLLFVTPERFEDEAFARFLSEVQVSMVVIDEAHYIASAGCGFRPAYGHLTCRLNDLIIKNPSCRLLLSSATLRYQDAETIAVQCTGRPLKVVSCKHLKTPHVRIDVRLMANHQKIVDTLNIVDRTMRYGATLIYASDKTTVGAIHERLRIRNIDCRQFHGALTPENKNATLEWFKQSTNGVLVSTSALGAGFNKANIRTVIHYHPPRSVEEYMQEIGRAGRDGENADAVLLYNGAADDKLNSGLINSSAPGIQTITAFCEWLSEQRLGTVTNISARRLQLVFGARLATTNNLRLMLKQCRAKTGAIEFMEDNGLFDVAIHTQIDLAVIKGMLLHTLNAADRWAQFRQRVLLGPGCKYQAMHSLGKSIADSPSKHCSCCYPNSTSDHEILDLTAIRDALSVLARRLAKRLCLPSFAVLSAPLIENIIRHRPASSSELLQLAGVTHAITPQLADEIIEVFRLSRLNVS